MQRLQSRTYCRSDQRWLIAFFEMDVVIVLGIMVRELVGFSLTEDVEIIVVFRRNL